MLDIAENHKEHRQFSKPTDANSVPVIPTEPTPLKHLGVDSMTSASAHPSTVKPMVTALQLNSTTWCPDNPPFLVGALAGLPEEVTPQFIMEQFPELEKGGRLRPKDCTPRQRLAIVIPYRNRYPHLHIVINNLLPTLKRQQADVTFFVIEQAPPEVFNRGALLNVGFLEAEKLASFDCYIFHDADMIPLHDHNFYRCGDNPRHYAVAINKFDYKLPYQGYVGAVVGFTKKQYLTINGCSNIYFGWGGEDDDMYSRARNKKYQFLRYEPNIGSYSMINHKRDLGNEVNALSVALLQDAYKRQDVEGLNATKYTVNSVRQETLYTWINVSLNMTEILLTAPKATLDIINKTLPPAKQIKPPPKTDVKQ
ncbi:hypothetical protein BsWGS_03719 [Bradybaena similaris]